MVRERFYSVAVIAAIAGAMVAVSRGKWGWHLLMPAIVYLIILHGRLMMTFYQSWSEDHNPNDLWIVKRNPPPEAIMKINRFLWKTGPTPISVATALLFGVGYLIAMCTEK